MKYPNPFKPTAGAEPPVLVGRSEVLEDFAEGLEGGVGAPARLMRITGPRGSGKTVLLTELGDIARRSGWRVIDETARAGMNQAVLHRLIADGHVKDASISANLVVVDASARLSTDKGALSLRDALDAEATRLTKKDKGLLVTIDEVQNASEEDITELAVATQHLIREKKNIAFVFAGITTGVMGLLNGEGTTFLRRAKAEELGAIPLSEVKDAFRRTIVRNGMQIEEAALDKAAQVTQGYAYFIQLVGYNIWREARRHAGESTDISLEDVGKGARRAIQEFETGTLMAAIDDLPKTAMEYLLAMSEDAAASSTGEIAKRLGLSQTSLSATRRLLIDRQLVEPTARGYIGFSIPFMKEFLVNNRQELLARYGVIE